jgi:hypothetical protein
MFKGASCPVYQGLMMDAASISETSVNFYQTTLRYNPEYSHLKYELIWKFGRNFQFKPPIWSFIQICQVIVDGKIWFLTSTPLCMNFMN